MGDSSGAVRRRGAGKTRKSRGAAILPYVGQKYYELRINNGTWKLPLVQVGLDTWIAYFDSLGDVRLVKESSEALAEHMKGCDILVTSESKGIALTHAIAAALGHKRFVVCRKEIKQSMVDPLVVRYRPITSQKELLLCIDSGVSAALKGKRVGLIDDIVSTRATIDAMEKLVVMAGGNVAARAAILVEGSAHTDIANMGVLPVFKKRG